MPTPVRKCKSCLTFLPITDFYVAKGYVGGRRPQCKKCFSTYVYDKHRSNPRHRLYLSSALNAKRKGLVHTIKPSDVPLPRLCKYLGVVIDYSRADERGSLRVWNGPSIDRIDPSRGYEPDNIQVISDLANRMKSNATVEQMLAFARGVLRVHGDE